MNYSKRLSRKNGICLWIMFLPLRGLFETPLKTSPLLRLAEIQNVSCHGCVPAWGSQAWTTAWGFRSDLATPRLKWWDKFKQQRNLGLGLIEHGSSWKFLNYGQLEVALCLSFCICIWARLLAGRSEPSWSQQWIVTYIYLCHFYFFGGLTCKSFAFKTEKFSCVCVWTSTN